MKETKIINRLWEFYGSEVSDVRADDDLTDVFHVYFENKSVKATKLIWSYSSKKKQDSEIEFLFEIDSNFIYEATV